MKKGNASGIVRSSSNRIYTEKKENMINYINISQLINERNKQLERFQICKISRSKSVTNHITQLKWMLPTLTSIFLQDYIKSLHTYVWNMMQSKDIIKITCEKKET